MIGDAQRGDGGVAAHETDQSPLDPRIEAQPARDELIDPRSHEAGAARDDQMSDLPQRFLFRERRDRGQGELGRLLGVKLHALRRRGQAVAEIESAGRDRRSTLGVRQYRPAMGYAGPRRHPPEQGLIMAIGEPGRRPGDEILMDVEIGHGRADRVQMRAGSFHLAIQHDRSCGRTLSPIVMRAPRRFRLCTRQHSTGFANGDIL